MQQAPPVHATSTARPRPMCVIFQAVHIGGHSAWEDGQRPERHHVRPRTTQRTTNLHHYGCEAPKARRWWCDCDGRCSRMGYDTYTIQRGWCVSHAHEIASIFSPYTLQSPWNWTVVCAPPPLPYIEHACRSRPRWRDEMLFMLLTGKVKQVAGCPRSAVLCRDIIQ